MADTARTTPTAEVHPIPQSQYAQGEVPRITADTTSSKSGSSRPAEDAAPSALPDDSELVRLKNAWLASSARCLATARRHQTSGKSSFDDAAWAAEVALSDALEAAIILTPASGRDGLWAKLTLLSTSEGDYEVEMKHWIAHHIAEGADSYGEATLYSIALDVWRMIRPVEIGMGLAGKGEAPLSASPASEAA